MPHRGQGATLGLGVESTYGTAVARTNWLRLASHSIKRDRTKEIVPHLGSITDLSSNPKDFYVASDNVGGSFSWPMAYDDSTVRVVKHILGASASTGPGPADHSLTLASPLPSGLTLEVISGMVDGTGNTTEVFSGCLLGSAGFSIEAGGVMMGEATVIGVTSNGLEAAGTPTYSTGGQYIRHNHAGTFTIGATTFALRSMRINVDRGLQRNQELGSLYTSRPVEERLMVDLEFGVLWQTHQFDASNFADTQADAEIAFTGSGPNALSIIAHNLLIMDVSRPVSGPGGIAQTIRAKAFQSSPTGDQGLEMLFSNANASHAAN